ncbi:hypothetical protein Rumeso_04988 [Rubellimicrobium mesophilum DSM 19309]|uniref:DUF3168 domain-containing protein n=1 Tax=Rubellimicrobium mesophilum DSM 19309 TaxID=442562 RepID=A0A017HAU0_9RHOB|nr:DUF3168 domain-containing protein [Rubellimicrobium mesophilum]EYD71587.1 hypothetical protein Rumeso_04988 [Rubellimicrobium mesophilum DSM 19309]
MEEDLKALLLADSTVPTLVPPGSINWRRRPQGIGLPAIVLRVINDRPVYTLSDTTDRSTARVQVDCWSLSYKQVKAISRAVLLCLSGHRDATFSRIWLLGARDTQDPEAKDDPAGVSLDFEIDYRVGAA